MAKKKESHEKMKDTKKTLRRADFTHFLLKIASDRYLNRMTQDKPFWKAERMDFQVHKRKAATDSVHGMKKSDKDSPDFFYNQP